MTNLNDILNQNAMYTSKIYSRNEPGMTMGPGHFLTTGDGIRDKRFSIKMRQPKQTYYMNKKRMNKTMVGSMNKSGSHEYSAHSGPPKRSASGKVKKRHPYPKDAMMNDLSGYSGKGDFKHLDLVPQKTKSQKPKSGRHISRNNKNVAIYTMAPVMTMTYKKKVKNSK